jgi:hypothetical protein
MGVVYTSTSQGVMFAYDLRLGRSIHHWKGIAEKNTFHMEKSSSPGSHLCMKSPKNVVSGLKTTLKVWDPKNYRKNLEVEISILSQWNRWVATDIHLDHSYKMDAPMRNVKWAH